MAPAARSCFTAVKGNTKLMPGRSVRVMRVHASNNSKNIIGEAWANVQREIRRNVEVNPDPAPKPTYGKDPVGDTIRKNERYALDGWTSTKFHVTGVAVALALAIAIVVQGPPVHM
ncbi:hypothetical protein BSKO_01771 [Bryopsis sp. KO-2023]|nr:hypothetical protein BSKO_01771 [Bryopsis sp. KO-2023]